ncbi:MAG TPA: MFS transporter [Magnetospirillaceae bacterium]|nr:MFS transporter [Magnetospirillaceae bacterium]
MNGLQAALAAKVGSRFHYAWVVAAAIFVALLISAGVRSMPGVLLVPLEKDLHWDRASVSAAISVGIALYGLMGPFAAAIMQSFGVRRTILAALALMAVSIASTTLVREPWQMMLSWGVLNGIATGTVANVLGATIVSRWFKSHRGLAMGLMAASVSTGQLVFLPVLAVLIDAVGWRNASLSVAGVSLLVLPVIFFLVPERPLSIGARALGSEEDDVHVRPAVNPLVNAFVVLGRGMKRPIFWLLFASFFVCGLSTNGLVGTHLIAFCLDHGIPEVQGAGLLAAMGILDLFGTTGSGWLSDRFNNKVLLAWYYGLRGLSLVYLVYSDFSFWQLTLFAVFYGLDWIATVPPTLRLTAEAFGDRDAPILFGWIAAGHQIGAAAAAMGAGLLRTELDTYWHAFLLAGIACVTIAMVLLGSAAKGRGGVPRVVTAEV